MKSHHTLKQLLIATALAFVSSAVLTPKNAQAGSGSTVWVWPASMYDQDGDGYAPWDANTSDRVVVAAPDNAPLYCPEGYVRKRGDFDDLNSEVHPRRSEAPFNNVDDDCDGKVDEPSFIYSPSGNNNTVDGFDLAIVINDAEVVEFLNKTRSLLFTDETLAVGIEYQSLALTGRTFSRQPQGVGAAAAFGDTIYITAHLGGLTPGRVYRARVQFYKRAVLNVAGVLTYTHEPVGGVSDWYYSMTDHSSRLGQARKEIVLQGFFEFNLSEHWGEVGYGGRLAWDGTRYGADVGEAWCSEFYSTVASTALKDMGALSFITPIADYFGPELFTTVTSPDDYVGQARPGDYLALDTDSDGNLNHSNMFLAYDRSTGVLFTLDGNADGDDGGAATGIARSRVGGSEVWVRESDPYDVGGWGRLDSGLMK